MLGECLFMIVFLIIAGLIAALFLFRRNGNVVPTTIKLIITLILFSPMLTAVAGAKLAVEYLTHVALARAMIPLSIYILFYIVSPGIDD